MMPIPSRGAIIAVLVAAMVSYVWWIHYDRNRIQSEFNTYKELINDQIAQNKAEAAAEKKRQDAKYQSAQTSYESSVSKLNATLKRLRDAQALSGSSPLPVASGSSGPVPPSPADTANATGPSEAGAGTCTGTKFWEDALADTLQCRTLIEFVKRP
jgi:hypothetical protein